MTDAKDDRASSSDSSSSSMSNSPELTFEIKKRKRDPNSFNDGNEDDSQPPKKKKKQDLETITILATTAVSQLINTTIPPDDINDYSSILPKEEAKKNETRRVEVVQKHSLNEKKSVSDDEKRSPPSEALKQFFAISIDDTDALNAKKKGMGMMNIRRRRKQPSESQKLLAKIKEEIKTETDIDEDLEISVVNSRMPYDFKKKVIKILMKAGSDQARGTTTGSDYQRAIKFTSDLLSIPWEKYSEIPVSLKDNEKFTIKKYIADQIQRLDKNVYGMEKVKQELVEYLITKISNPSSQGDVIGLVGAPGIGKTMIAKFIADFLSTKLYTINLGGQKDSHFLKGHGRLYVDSTYGVISQAVIETKVMNPCVRLDELDKISETHRDDIFGVLTHALDPESNDAWLDDYFSGFPINLKGVTWIISYNDPSIVHKDLPVGSRMKIINVPDYSIEDKIRICKDYILPDYLKEFDMTMNDIIISDQVVKYIIERYSPEEKGVRNAKRAIQSLVRKIQTLIIVGEDNSETSREEKKITDTIKNIIKMDSMEQPVFPLEISEKMVDKLFVNYKSEQVGGSWQTMYL